MKKNFLTSNLKYSFSQKLKEEPLVDEYVFVLMTNGKIINKKYLGSGVFKDVGDKIFTYTSIIGWFRVIPVTIEEIEQSMDFIYKGNYNSFNSSFSYNKTYSIYKVVDEKISKLKRVNDIEFIANGDRLKVQFSCLFENFKPSEFTIDRIEQNFIKKQNQNGKTKV